MSKSLDKKATQVDVVILGAGAAGLFCAFTAARRGRKVLLLEKSNKAGKKILMSGGGRCNFTNHFVSAENYISNNPHFCKSALKGFTQWDFITMVEDHGIAFEERKHSQLFCLNSAKDILNMLLKECERVGVQIKTQCEITEIRAGQDGEGGNTYQIKYLHDNKINHMVAESLVVATGALSIPSLGGSGMGYDIAKQFSLPLTERRAGLVPFMFSDATKLLCERLSGLALEIEVTCNKQSFVENMLFTHRGISGPAMLQISNYWNLGDEIVIDLLPGTDARDLLIKEKSLSGKNRLQTVLSKHLPKALLKELQMLWWPEQGETPLAEFNDKSLQEIGKKINAWNLKPSSTEGYRTAEVTLGGVDTDALSSKTMEVKGQKGLYFIGEVVDVSGHLGGFNFQWAWSSAHAAGLYV
ncbi:NAD(P)/FAD-dependent oxidoreductase [Aurantivibrio infirmus]